MCAASQTLRRMQENKLMHRMVHDLTCHGHESAASDRTVHHVETSIVHVSTGNVALGQLHPCVESAACLSWRPHGLTWPNRLAAQPHRGVYHALQAVARHPDALLNVDHFRDGNCLHAGATVILGPDLQRGCLIRLPFSKSLQPAQQYRHSIPHHAFSL